MPERSRAPRRPFLGCRVVLGVTGGIAAYKVVQLARDLTQAGAEVDVVLSAGALEFVRPLSFEALTGRPAYTSMYEPGAPLRHIQLAREADLVLVAPATANFMARAAAGAADDLLTAVLLATRAPVLLCPAMNDRMYMHPQTSANLHRLSEIGYGIVPPATGPLAFGEGEGPGRLPDPADLMQHAARALERADEFRDLHVVVSAGPTREALDPVRFIGNRSSGRMGYALAESAWRRGARVSLVSGPTALTTPVGCDRLEVESAEEMRTAIARLLPSADVLVMAAAVADFRPVERSATKIKKEEGSAPAVQLERTADVLLSTSDLRPPGLVTVGFALETDDPLDHGRAKLRAKTLDLVVVNDATEPGAGFEVPTNRVTLLASDGSEQPLALLPKEDVADAILDRVASILASRHS